MASVKTAVSLPEDLFCRMEALARERKQTRSGLMAEAMEKYLFDDESQRMMDAWAEVVATPMTPEEQAEEDAMDAFRRAVNRRTMERLGPYEC